jgi:hypothetical protein
MLWRAPHAIKPATITISRFSKLSYPPLLSYRALLYIDAYYSSHYLLHCIVTISQPLRRAPNRFLLEMELDFFCSVTDVVEWDEVDLVVECCLFGGGFRVGLWFGGVRLL